MTWLNTEVSFGRKQTQTWINVEGLMISLTRPGSRQRTAAGGYAEQGNAEELPPVKRVVSVQARETFAQIGSTGAGVDIKQYILGTYDDDIRQGDYFVHPVTGRTYTVEYVHPDRSIETRGELTELS